VNSDYKYCNVVINCDEREGHPRCKRGREGTEGAEIGNGYLRGKYQGGFDRKHDRINMLDPSESLKI